MEPKDGENEGMSDDRMSSIDDLCQEWERDGLALIEAIDAEHDTVAARIDRRRHENEVDEDYKLELRNKARRYRAILGLEEPREDVSPVQRTDGSQAEGVVRRGPIKKMSPSAQRSVPVETHRPTVIAPQNGHAKSTPASKLQEDIDRVREPVLAATSCAETIRQVVVALPWSVTSKITGIIHAVRGDKGWKEKTMVVEVSRLHNNKTLKSRPIAPGSKTLEYALSESAPS